MTLSATETLALYQQPVDSNFYSHIARLQNVLLRIGSRNGDLGTAALRMLDMFSYSDLRSMLMELITDVKIENPSESALGDITSPTVLINEFSPYVNTVQLAIRDSIRYLPEDTISILNDHNTIEEPIEKMNLVSFLILATNLQG